MNANGPRLTIVMPLKGRPLFTLRFLYHAERLKLPYRFILADGEVIAPLAEILENSRTHFPSLDIEYIRYPDDRDLTYFLAKMSDAVGRVKTRYTMVADNDDFLAVTGIEGAADFLDANPDYICCNGRVANFRLYSGLNNAAGGLTGKLNKIWDCYPFEQIEHEAFRDRIRYGAHVTWMYYGVIHTSKLAQIWKDTAAIGFHDFLLHETFHAARVLSLGRAHMLGGVVNYFRQVGTSTSGVYAIDWVAELMRTDFSAQVRGILECIGKEAAQAGEDPGEVVEDVRQLLIRKFQKNLSGLYSLRRGIKKRVAAISPHLITWFNNRPRSNSAIARRTFLASLERAGTTVDYINKLRDELVCVEEVVSGRGFRDFLQPYLPRFAVAATNQS